MTMPTSLCPYAMRVESVRQETPDVWTISLSCKDEYHYLPGQYALVSIRQREDVLRAYTLSSSPGLSPFITLTVRAIPQGEGSQWLTQEVREGETLWLSAAQGEFSCVKASSSRYLMLAAGCGITPVMSMTRWLLANRPEADIVVFYNVRSPQDVIFSNEWKLLQEHYTHRLSLFLMAEQNAEDQSLAGRITLTHLKERVPDIAERTVMTCGPQAYMTLAEQLSADCGVPENRFYKEQFHSTAECSISSMPMITITSSHPSGAFQVPKGTLLLDALEKQKIPVIAACRAGVCGACKTRILKGKYTTQSQVTLTEEEIADGYVLACSCQLQGDIELA